MKRHFLVVALILIFVNIGSVFASNFTEINTENNSCETTVIYNVSDSYLISIPETFDLKQDEEVSRTVYAEDIYIGYGMELRIKISGANCLDDGSWYITGESPENTSNKYEYTIGTKTELEDVKDESVIISVQAGDLDGDSQTLFFNLKDTVTKPGVYSDTLTFSVSIVEAE